MEVDTLMSCRSTPASRDLTGATGNVLCRDGICCGPGSALDLDGRCCERARLDVCGQCGGHATAVDIAGA